MDSAIANQVLEENIVTVAYLVIMVSRPQDVTDVTHATHPDIYVIPKLGAVYALQIPQARHVKTVLRARGGSMS